MRRITLVLVCLAAITMAGAGAAQAGPHGGHHKGWGGPTRGWHGHRGGRPHGGHGGYCGPGWYGARPVYGYPAPVYPAYPQAGFGLAMPNFSLWFAQ